MHVLPTPVGPATTMGSLLLRLAPFATLLFDGLGAAHDKLSAHVILVVQLGDCAFRLVDALHLHKCESLRFLRMLVRDDLNVLDRADSVEKFEKIALRRVKRQIAHIDSR